MRKIGTLPTPELAARFERFLRSKQIAGELQPAAEGVTVWIHEEDQLGPAREHLAAFQASPQAREFDVADAPPPEKPAETKLAARRRRARRFAPTGEVYVTTALLLGSLMVTLLTWFGEQRPGLVSEIMFSNFTRGGYLLPKEIREGEVWRFWSPIFLHLDPLHLLFNMMFLWRLGMQIELIKGSWMLAGLVAVVAPVSNYAQFYFVHGQGGGMSGVVYGLFGFVWMRSKLLPEDGFWINPDTIAIMLAWMFLCMTGVMGPIANWAHVAGLAAGMALGASPRLWRTA